jgi:hypothetical protein
MDELLMLQKIVSIYTVSGDSLNLSCKRTAQELDPPDWTWNYIKKLVGENPPNPGDELRTAIRALYREKFHKPRSKSFSVKVTAKDKQEKKKWLEMIPMERRQELFRQEVERLENPDSSSGVFQLAGRFFKRKNFDGDEMEKEG